VLGEEELNMPRFIYNIEGIDEATRSLRLTAATGNPVRSYMWNDDFTEIIEVDEVIESWDLERYQKNNIFLWQHDRWSIPIGLGMDLQAAGGELQMRLQFAQAEENPLAEQLWKCYRCGLIKAFSVGFRRGREEIEQGAERPLVRLFDCELLEVSGVTVPADEDALVSNNSRTVYVSPEALGAYDIDADVEQMRAITTLLPSGAINKGTKSDKERISEAARLLASKRKPKKYEEKQDRSDEETVQRFDFFGRLGDVERLDTGAVRVPATLSSVGVFRYRQADGTWRRELRHPDEVFHQDSVNSLRGVPVTDRHIGSMIRTDTWKQFSVGHTEDPTPCEQSHLDGYLVVSDEKAIADIDAGDRKDLSPGYRCRMDHTPGVWNGQEYDVVQRDIRYNHIALMPPGGGRQGSTVALRLDAKDAIIERDAVGVQETNEETMAADNVKTKILVKLDGKEFEQGSPEHVAKLEAINSETQARLDAADADHKKKVTELEGERDQLQAKLDAKEKDSKDLQEKLDAAQSPEAIQGAVNARLEFLEKARAVFGDEKLDGKDPVEGTEREVMVAAIKFDDKDWVENGPDGKPRSDEYIRCRFDMIAESAQKEAKNHKERGINSVVATHREATGGTPPQERTDASDGPIEPTHRHGYQGRGQQRWQKTLGSN
jgi:hypothetical protein